MRILLIASTTLGILVASALALLLIQANSELSDNRSRLEAAKNDLQASRAQSDQLAADLGAARGQLTSKTAENETLTADLSAANAQLAGAMAENAGLKAELGVTTEQLAARTSSNESLTADLLASSEQLGRKTAENEALTANLEALTRQLADKSAEYDALLQAVGTLEALTADRDKLLGEIEALRTSIRELERQRTPLIVHSQTQGFRCTGSMEPKITCLDSASWLRNFNPEDVTIGSVIVFTPTAECEIGQGTVSHRVMDIREVDGTYYYWPKGDANPDADGCWIPDANVYGYMIELHKDTHPQNTGLRNRVNAAKEKRDETFAAYTAAEKAYNERYRQYCGHNPDACSLDPARVAELDKLYAEYIRLFNIHQEAFEAWNAVFQEAWTTI